MDEARLKALTAACGPEQPVAASDPRFVDIDAIVVDGDSPRGGGLARQMERRIGRASEPLRLHFSGLPGSGKSTELKRLASLLAARRFLVVTVDAEDTIDLRAPIDVPDVLFTVLYETEIALAVRGGKSPDAARADAGKEGWAKRFWHWLNTTRAEFEELGVKVGDDKVLAVDLALSLKTQPRLRERMQAAVAARLSDFLREVREEMQRFEAQAKTLSHAGLVIIVDSLEKLEGTETSFKPVIESAERVFASDFLSLPVHTVFSVSPAVALRANPPHLAYLPMIKLSHRDGKPSPAGARAARELVSRRIPDPDLASILGRDTFEHHVDTLIRASGGYPRDLVRLLLEVVSAYDDAPLDARAVDAVVRRAGEPYRRIARWQNALPWLAQVALTKRLAAGDREDIAMRMITQCCVLRYVNDEEWVDVHPALAGMEDLQVEVAKLRGLNDVG